MTRAQLSLLFSFLFASYAAADFSPRHIPIRWVELHASRHPECQDAAGTPFRGPLPAQTPAAWRSSEWLTWMLARVNAVYENTGIEFWLLSHDVYCTGTIAEWENSQSTPYTWEQVRADLRLLYPHAELHDFAGEALARERWLEKAELLYGDPHVMTVIMHNDYQAGTGGARIQPDILPQHGYGPWYTPGTIFMFLSGVTRAANWQFDPELTVAHEIGHALGHCHTLDFEVYCVGAGGTGDAIFPDSSPYAWADHWDLAYVRTRAGGVSAFASRTQAQNFVAVNGTGALRRIDDHFNIALAPNGAAVASLEKDPVLTFDSEAEVLSAGGFGQVRLLQGLSFELPYVNSNSNIQYFWQRNIMSYRYQEQMNPYDFLTARFSPSQIEIMQRQLQGSTPFMRNIHGSMPVGTSQLFASQYQLLGDGSTNDFVWYSNGQGPSTVDSSDDLPDQVAFRLSPYRHSLVGQFVAPDLNADLIMDPLGPIENGAGVVIYWSQPPPVDDPRALPTWKQEIIGELSGITRVATGDFDGNGAPDLLLLSNTASDKIIYLKNSSGHQTRAGGVCANLAACTLRRVDTDINIEGAPAVGNFDGLKGDDLLWGLAAGGRTRARLLTANGRRGFKAGRTLRLVGSGMFTPLSGDFNGAGGQDVIWLENSGAKQVMWWGKQRRRRTDCGSVIGKKCVWGNLRRVNRLAGIDDLLAGISTVGDFDGNGADDLLIRLGNTPRILFSAVGKHYSYADKFTALPVALHNSPGYGAIAGEFDNAVDSTGQRLGDDIILY